MIISSWVFTNCYNFVCILDIVSAKMTETILPYNDAPFYSVSRNNGKRHS
jgi:hypothetical protein